MLENSDAFLLHWIQKFVDLWSAWTGYSNYFLARGCIWAMLTIQTAKLIFHFEDIVDKIFFVIPTAFLGISFFRVLSQLEHADVDEVTPYGWRVLPTFFPFGILRLSIIVLDLALSIRFSIDYYKQQSLGGGLVTGYDLGVLWLLLLNLLSAS